MPLVDTAKITPPRLPVIVPRPRLIKSLDREKEKKLILILGQAAQGKTTLAVSWISKSTMPWAWLNLGPEDSDPVNLFYAMVDALQEVFQDVDFIQVRNFPTISLGPREELPLFRDWALAVFGATPVPVRVVFDGLDRLVAGTQSFRFLQVLLDHLPAHFHFLFLSREMPPLELQLLQMRQEAFVVTNEEMCFTAEETRQFVRNLRNLILTPAAMKRLQNLTEGWVGGLVLLCELLARVPEPLRENFISERTASQFRREICRYFGDSIFAARPGQVQEVLIKSSILNILEPDFLRDLLGIANVREILEDFTRKNLFVQSSFDDRKGWSFRFHQLFRDFLRTRFKTDLPPHEQQALYRRAGSLSEARGDLEAAVRYYLRAEAFSQAAATLKRIGLDLLRAGRTADLSRWLAALPEEMVQAQAWLLFYRFMTNRFLASREHLALLEQSFDLFQQQGEVRGSLLSLAYLIEACTHGHLPVPLAPLLARGEELLQSLAYERYPYERAVLLLHMGFGYSLRGGNARKGFLSCENAYLIARDLGELPLMLHARINAVLSLVMVGEFARAAELRQEVEQAIAQCPYPDLIALHLLISCKYFIIRGELDQAGPLVRRTQGEIQQHGLMYLFPPTLIDQMMVNFFAGNYQEALDIGRQFLHLASAMGNRFLLGLALEMMGMSLIHKGDYQGAEGYVQEGTRISSASESLAPHNLKFNTVMMGTIACHLGKVNEGIEADLEDVLTFAIENSDYPLMTESNFVLALVKRAQGMMAEALRNLQAALGTARQRDLYHFFMVTRPDLAALCLLSLEQELEGVQDYAAHLLTTRLADLAGPELARLTRHPKDSVADRALEILRAIRRAGLPRLRLKTLGAFQAWRGETLITDRDWEGQLPRILLKALIVRGSQAVPKDVLMEDLWPEAAPAEAENKFKSCLHRLRKALEADLDRIVGSCFVHLEANLLSLDQELVQVDVDAFAALAAAGKKHEAAGDLKAALTSYQEAADLYAGDFLPEELYHPWAERKREALRGLYLEVLERQAGLYEKQGSLRRAVQCWQKAIQTDPLEPQPVQRLMLLYDRLGRPQAALRVFTGHREALKRELDAAPDDVTTAIYRKIKEKC